MIENPGNFSAYLIIEISSVLYSAYLIPRDQDNFIFYLNNYINCNLLNQLYDLNLIKKLIKNADAVACKLRLTSIRATNQNLKVTKKESRKKEEMMGRQKMKTIIAKYQRAREGISWSGKEEKTYESNDGDKTDSDQVGNVKAHCNSEKRGQGKAIRYDLNVTTYIEKSSLLYHNLFPLTSNTILSKLSTTP